VQTLLSSNLLSKKFKIKIYRIIILPFVLYGCETWSLILREESRLREFENRVLRRNLDPRGTGLTGEWRKLHNEEINDLYSSLNTFRVIKLKIMRWAGHVALMGRGEAYTGFWWGKPEGKSPLGRLRPRWEDNIKMDLQEWNVGGMDWIELDQDRDRWRALVNAVMKLRVP